MAGTSWEEVLVESVRREDGHRTHAAWQWCVVLVMRVWPLSERGALVVVNGGAGWGGDSSSHEAGASWEEVLVKGVRRKDGHETHAAWQWCVVLVVQVWPLGERGALVVVIVVELAGVRAAARTKLARPGRKCWSKVFEERTGVKCTLLGSGVWCSSGQCGLWEEAHLLWG